MRRRVFWVVNRQSRRILRPLSSGSLTSGNTRLKGDVGYKGKMNSTLMNVWPNHVNRLPAMYRSVLVAVDGRNQPLEIAKAGIRLAESFTARLHVIFIIDSKLGHSPRWMNKYEQKGNDIIDRINKSANGNSVPVETALKRGRFVNAVLDYIEKRPIDLIVIGSQEQMPIQRWFTRTIPEKLTRNSRASVLIVGSGDDELTQNDTRSIDFDNSTDAS